MKKIVQLGAAVMLMICSWFYSGNTASVYAEEMLQTEDGIYYEITEQNTIRIIGAKSSLAEMQIPSEIDGIPVTQIGDYAFLDHTRLRSIVLPDSLQEIGNYAFLDCSRLESIQIPATLQNVGWGILSDTPWLTEQEEEYVIIGNQILIAYKGTSEHVVIPEGVRVIAGFTFEKNMTIQSVQLPDSLTSLNAYAFAGCRNLQTVQLPFGLQWIGDNAFFECKQLQQLTIPDSVTEIGERAFYQCTALQTVCLPNGLREISSGLFYCCAALKEIQLPDSVESIAAMAFQNCTSLRSVVLSEHVYSIGQDAFANCDSLQQIVLKNANCILFQTETTFPVQAIVVSENSGSVKTYADSYQRAFVDLPVLYGDVDGDGNVMVEDAVLILTAYARSSAGLQSQLSDRQKIAADYNQDGSIQVEDAVSVLTYYARRSAGLEG